MVQYNFKKITVVPEAKDFINIALSRTQRKTPTVVHSQFQIQRIRRFYMRKVKFTQVTIHDKFSLLLEEFPRLEDIHPFYADLMNVLYDKDHYKLALGQINTARNLIDGVGRDYVRLLKYGDSLYRCKQLKRAALGRMVTILKKQAGSLAYLENVRQHLARLPTIDPTTRTIILCGYPNVGKSSFMNKVTRANVEVQPYAFTTKSLFVGHTEYKYLKWQVIDTPGILDHPLEERNTIEMQSITALAHLRACVLFLIDMSEHCGYSIKQQVDLFNSIKPLFTGKPLLIVLTKTDLIRYENLSKENRELLESIAKSSNVEMMGMSNITDEGISEVKQKACDVLLQHRVESKLGKTGKTLENILNRIHLAQPIKRDEKKRETTIPQSVVERQKMEEDGMEVEPRKTERDLEQENGGAGVYDADLKRGYKLKNPEWTYDIVPEIMDGKNIADYVDPEVLKMLDQLEKEEDELIEKGDDDIDYGAEDVFVSKEDEDMHERIESKKAVSTQEKKLNNKKSKIPKKYKPVDVDKIAEELVSRGVDKEVIERARSRSRALSKVRTPSKTSSRARSLSEQRGIAEAEAKEESKLLGKRKRTLTPSNRSLSASDKYSGIRNPNEQYRAIWTGRKKQRVFTQDARPSESDRHVFDLKPKHLYSGKRGNGKTERR